MNRSITTKLIAVGAVALGALGLTQAAQARTDVTFAIGIPAYVEPAPVYVAPQAAYVESAPVYVTPGYAYEREREWRREAWRREEWRRAHRWHERHDAGYYR